jgi:DNA-binding NtrC family response regulator
MKILIVDDETLALTSVRRLLRHRGFSDVEICDNGRAAVDRIRAEDYDIVLLDILMPEMDGLQVLEAAKPHKPLTEFIILTAVEDLPTSVRAIRLGAYDYLVKPIDPDRLLISIRHAFERKSLRASVLDGSPSPADAGEIPEPFRAILTRNARMKTLIRYAHTVAKSGLPILITGESGTGKELFARAIHGSISGAERPFVPVNVAAVPETLFESQFFGHSDGAFTGATGSHMGYFQQADGGTLYLDEIGELPFGLQAKFLRVLEEQTVTRLGERKAHTVRVQIVSSTNTDLNAACQEGRFRLDLFYRLNAAQIHLPPLHQRSDDIPMLAAHFLAAASQRFGKAVEGIRPDALEILTQTSYPGNVRELMRRVETAVVVCDDRHLTPRHFAETRASAPEETPDNPKTLRENTEFHVARVIRMTDGDLKAAADILGITLRQVQRRVAEMKKDPRWNDLFGNS